MPKAVTLPPQNKILASLPTKEYGCERREEATFATQRIPQ